MESTKAPHVKKGKKKQVKDELDRMKQAEKKRRRLEKALATSAAIRSELEKKKQKKKEEQQRLDEEGAAIAEAVALHVLIGEDSDDSSNLAVKNDEEFNPWRCAADISLYMDNRRSSFAHPDLRKCSFQSIGCVPRAYGYSPKWNSHFRDGNWSLPSPPLERNFHLPYVEERRWVPTDASAGLIAAQAVSSLRIVDDGQVDAVLFNGY